MRVSTKVAWLRRQLREMPIVAAGMLIGLGLFGMVGGVVGLVIGLAVHPPTAWAAALEIGGPAGALGWMLGLVAGLVVQWLVSPDPAGPPVDDDSRPVAPAC